MAKLWISLRKRLWKKCGNGARKVVGKPEKACSGCSVLWGSVRFGGESGEGCGFILVKLWESFIDKNSYACHGNRGFPRAYYYNY